MRETSWHITIILLVGGAIFFTQLGASKLWDRDEPRNAGCAKEMMARSDWVVPMFNDELRHQKPVLLYWLIMSAYSVLGVSEFSARFWSAALALGTTLATYGIASRLVNRSAALLAAVSLATCLMFDVAARAVTPDSVLIFCSTSAILAYVWGTFRKTDHGVQLKIPDRWFPQDMVHVIGMYVMLGLGVLAKGPIGFLLPMATIGWFMLIQTVNVENKNAACGRELSRMKRLRDAMISLVRPFHPIHFLKTLTSMKPIMGAIVVLVVALPWYVIVDIRTEGDFTRLFFVGEHFGRATSTLENHSGGVWFYPLAILVGFFPWSVFWGPVVIGLFRDRSNQRPSFAICFALCWIGVQVITFSLAQTKLPSYVTPCYPGLAILTAICLGDLANGRSAISKTWFYLAAGGLVISGIGISAGIGWATLKYLPNQFWLAGLGVIPVVGGAVLIHLLRTNRPRMIPSVMAGTAFLFCWALFGWGTVSIDSEQQSGLILNEIANQADVDVAAYGCLESSWVFYGQHPIHELIVGPPVEPRASDTLRKQRKNFWAAKPRLTVEDFVNNHPNTMILVTDEHVESLLARLPDEFDVIQDVEYFLKNRRIYLLGKRKNNLPDEINRFSD